MPRDDDLRPETICVHGADRETPLDGGRPAAAPLDLTSVHEFPSIAAAAAALDGGTRSYRRLGHPNARALETALAALEGTEDALATASGMAAIACAVLARTNAGDALVCQADVYGGTVGFLRAELSRFGVETRAVDTRDHAAVADALRGPAAALFVETLSNPLLREADLPSLSTLCRTAGVPLMVDNTFATPILRRPAALGADVVVHSATKFIGGHHDLLAGVVAGSAEFVGRARAVAQRFGCTISAFDAWLASRGLRTLALRIARASTNAAALAACLREHDAVTSVHYPGWGPLLSFDVGSAERAEALVGRLRLVRLAPSLGGVATTISHPATSSHRGIPPAEREAHGIGAGLLRISSGIEADDDLRADLAQALAPRSLSE